jgi:Na+-transporting methylmalonyl-CoA/oxaloacetate decarboxylase gamma subunit
MSRRKGLLVLLILIFLVAILSTILLKFNPTQTIADDEPETTSPPPETPEPETPELVIPEAPLGTLGLVSAVAIGFGTFTLLSRRRN